jgi:hypothetical protein
MDKKRSVILLFNFIAQFIAQFIKFVQHQEKLQKALNPLK